MSLVLIQRVYICSIYILIMKFSDSLVRNSEIEPKDIKRIQTQLAKNNPEAVSNLPAS